MPELVPEINMRNMSDTETTRHRLLYMIQVYLYSLIFYAIAFAQWIIYRNVFLLDLFYTYYDILSIFFLIVGMILSVWVIHFYSLRNYPGCNWIMYLFIFELFVNGYAFYLVRGIENNFLIVCGGCCGYSIALTIGSHFIKFDFTQRLIKIFYLSVVNIVLMITFVVYILFYHQVQWYLEIVLGVPIFVIVSIAHVYLIQLVSGFQKLAMRNDEIMLTVFMIVDHFLTFVLTIYAIVNEEHYRYTQTLKEI